MQVTGYVCFFIRVLQNATCLAIVTSALSEVPPELTCSFLDVSIKIVMITYRKMKKVSTITTGIMIAQLSNCLLFGGLTN